MKDNTINKIILLLLAVFCGNPGYSQEANSDKLLLNAVVAAFQKSISEKDSITFKKLFFHENVPFTGIMSKVTEQSIKKNAPDFEGVAVSNSSKFIREICKANEVQTEKVYDINIHTDGIISSISFDYSYESGKKMIQWGHEKWNLVFAGGAWLITDVIYSIHFPGVEKFPYTAAE